MEIRLLKPEDDLKEIGEIYVQSWKYAYQELVPEEFLTNLTSERWVTGLKDASFQSFVMLDKGKIIGTAACGPARDETLSEWGELVSLYLLPEFTGKGYGKKLFNCVIKELETSGFTNIYLWVLEANGAARKFYESQGFEFSGDWQQITIADTVLTELRYCSRK